ncbi:uncharacterized protein N7515_006962 [Penicillium bovifimosum]|uniref:PXA domain-containing protein n=1 Tax=Penicillium bovifimosum TaxID=126998 RepID=A0A9W9L082_9EURO|nr:uncharacterized protein N7515_006962 [Penicillium bovifimosum]KAJ5130923.1 hypothetical protein N7515_006962 [Penicillium bovifimosum]
MNDSLRPGLQPISHLKAGPTTSSSRSTALPSPTTVQPPSRPSSRLRTQKTSGKDEPDAASDKATTALIRRVLCPQTGSYGASSPQPPEELLPPLTSSNDVDRQLYALLAIIIKEFVYSWYSKITPDQALVNEVLQVIAHCTRALEQRLRQIDVAQLALDEIPGLVEAHVLSYRLARQQSHLSGLPPSHRALYHELNPHPGLSPVPDPADPDTIAEQGESEAVYRRLLANGILAVLLPTEDLENNSLRTLVVDVIADLILGNQVSGRTCEGWFIWETITKLATRVGHRQIQDDTKSDSDSQANRLEKFGLLSTDDELRNQPLVPFSATAWIWNLLQKIYLGYVALRFIAMGLFRVASSPGPSSHGVGVSPPPIYQKGDGSESSEGVSSRPVLDYRVFSMISQILGISWRMPWLSGFLALLQYLILAGPGRVGATDGIFDRFLRETIEEYVLTPTLLPNLLLATRTALFPANTRPTSQTAVGHNGAPASAPQSVQTPTPSHQTLPTAASPGIPVVERVKGASTSDGFGKTSDTENKSDGNNDRGPFISPATTIPGPGPQGSRSSNPDPQTAPPINEPAEREKANRPTKTEIATIKRRCAASLLALIPRSVARAFLGLPPSAPPAPSVGDGTCSPNSSHSLATSPSRIGHDGSSLHSSEGNLASSSRPVASGHLAAGRLRTDDLPSAGEMDAEEVYLLQIIENDLLDLFADEYCNKHLVYAIVETVLGRLLPEMAERCVEDLLEDRGVASVPVPLAF